MARVVALLGLKRPCQGENLPSSGLHLDVPRWSFFKVPRSCILQDGRRAFLRSQHARLWRLLRRLLWPAFALRRAPSRRLVMPAHADCWGFSRRRPRLTRAFSWQRRQHLEPTPCLALCPGLQRLGLCGGGFLGHANELDAGGALGGGRCGVRVQRRSPWFVRVNDRAFNGLCARLLSRVDRPSAAKARSPCFMQESFIWIG